MTKVLIADALSQSAEEIFRANGVDVDTATGLKPEQLVQRIADYDGLAVRSATKVTAEVLAAAARRGSPRHRTPPARRRATRRWHSQPRPDALAPARQTTDRRS